MIIGFTTIKRGSKTKPESFKQVNIWEPNNFSWTGTKGLVQKKLISNFVFYPPELPCIRDNKTDDYTIIYEKDFEKIIYTWKIPTLDATWFALKLMDKLAGTVADENKVKISNQIESAKDKAKEILKTSIHNNIFVVNSTEKRSSLHTIHSGIGILRLLATPKNEQTNWNESTGKDALTQTLTDVLGDKALATKTINSCCQYIHKCLRNGSTFDEVTNMTPNVYSAGYTDVTTGKLPTITATASALWNLWQFGEKPAVDFDVIFNFTRALMKEFDDPATCAGFINSIIEEEPLICATYYAMRILYSIQKSINNEFYITDRLSNHERNAIKQFVLENITGGGISPKMGALPTIIHTKDAFALMQKKYNIFQFKRATTITKVTKLINQFDKFWKECSINSNLPLVGFSENTYYYPNIYATLLLYEADFYIKSLLNQNEFEGTDYNHIFTKDNTDTCFDFIDSCTMKKDYDKNLPGFRCYSYDPQYIPDSFLNRIQD